MIKMTKIEPEFIPDLDMCIFSEKGTRGGISYISNRYSEDNNKYLKSDDPKEESKHVIYTKTRKMYMVIQCLSFFQQVD